jgi:hypothetical protein
MGLLALTAVVPTLAGSGPIDTSRSGDAPHLFVEQQMSALQRNMFVDRLRPASTSRTAAQPATVGAVRGIQQKHAEFVSKLRSAGKDKRRLYQEYFDVIGANGILDGIEQVWPKCHSEAHDLGKVIHERLQDVGASLRVCGDRCFSGCMHGVLMEALGELAPGQASRATSQVGERTETAMFRPMMHQLCFTDPTMTASYSPGDCAHGVGHALMFLMDYDVPKAIGACREFERPAMKYYCATGAYMEYVVERDAEDASSRGLLYPCDIGQYPAACARYKMGYVTERHYRARRSTADLIAQCGKLAGAARRGCFHGIGNAHMGLIVRGQMQLRDVCRRGSADERVLCIEGAMERMGKYHPETALRVCNELEGSDKPVCLRAVQNKMYSMTKDLRLYLD